MTTVEAGLNIELNLLCPHCEDYINLMEIEGLNDEGQLLEVACPSKGHWSDSHLNFDIKIDCPDCKKEIHVNGIGW